MTIKDYLKLYENMVNEIRKLDNEIANLRQEYDSIRSSSDNDGMPHGTNIGKPTEDRAVKAADKIKEKEKEYKNLKEQCIERRDKVFRMILQAKGLEQDVLYARYIEFKTFRIIAEELCISERHCQRVHGNALQTLRKKMNNVIECHNQGK